MKTKIITGQKIWYKAISARHGDDLSLKESTVDTVGKKWFTLADKWLGRFSIETLLQDNGPYSSSHRVYLNKETVELETEIKNLTTEIRNYFAGYWELKLSIEELKEIKKIIKK